MPVSALVDECPLYDLEPQEPPDRLARFAAPAAAARARMPTRRTTLRALLGSENVASRRWVFEQYDCLVGSRTVRRPEQADAAVLRLALGDVETDRALAVSIDGNGRRVACDPYVGAAEAVCECAANLACVGAEPLGLTNCLNFGNPEKPHVAWQLTRAVEGMAAACRAFGVPGRGRQRVALQRGRRRDRSTRRRSSGWSASCPTPRAPARSAFARRSGRWSR